MAKNEQGNEVVNDTVVDEVAHTQPDIATKSEPTARDTGKEKSEAKLSVEERLDRIESHLRASFNNFGR